MHLKINNSRNKSALVLFKRNTSTPLKQQTKLLPPVPKNGTKHKLDITA